MQNTHTPATEATDNQIMHPGSRKLFCAWEKLRAEMPFPTRDDLNLREISDIVPDLVIIERDNLRNSYRFRLAGTRACELMAQNLTSTDALLGWDQFETDIVRKHFGLTLTTHQPTLMRIRLFTDSNDDIAVEFLGLPVLTRDKTRMQIVGGLFPFRSPRTMAYTAIKTRSVLAIRSIWTEHRAPEQDNVVHLRNFRLIKGGLAAV